MDTKTVHSIQAHIRIAFSFPVSSCGLNLLLAG